MTAKTTAKPPKEDGSFSRDDLFLAFYGAALGGGTLTGLITYGVTYLKDIDTQYAISLSTAAGAGASAVVTLSTAALFMAIRPKKEDYKNDRNFQRSTKDHNIRFACAASGAVLALTEMALIAGFNHVDGNITYKMKPNMIAPPTIVQNNSNDQNIGRTPYHTNNGFILSIA